MTKEKTDASTFNALAFMAYQGRMAYGHTHGLKYSDNSKYNSLKGLMDQYGKPTFWTFEEDLFDSGPRSGLAQLGHDYTVLQDVIGKEHKPLIIAWPLGVTIYNATTSHAEDQTRLFYKWFKH